MRSRSVIVFSIFSSWIWAWLGLVVDKKCDALETRIVSGDDASPDRFPYFVSLVDERFVHICGGTLISQDMVLSAAHCEM
jgi:secreted trypsin-like serine protease